MIEFKDIHKKYGKLEVLKGVNFTIKDGGIIAILGPNGSGKTTSMKSFLGMVVPTSPLLGACSAMLLDALKALAGIDPNVKLHSTFFRYLN